EEQAIDDAEHGGVGGNAESEREHHGGGEHRLAPETAQRVAEILGESAPPLRSLFAAETLAVDRGEIVSGAVDVAEAADGFASSVLGRHSLIHQIPHRHIEVELQLVLDGALDTGRGAVDAEKAAEDGSGHGRQAVWSTLNTALA